MTLTVELAGETFAVDAVHRLALAVRPIDAVTGSPVRTTVRVGREIQRSPARRPRRGDVVDPLAARFDVPLEARGTSAFLLRHRLDLSLPTPPDPLVRVVVIRLDDPGRRYVPRRLQVPLWSRQRIEESDPPTGPSYVTAAQRTIRAVLLPGSSYEPAPGTTGIRGRLRRGADPVPWPRVQAFGAAGEPLGFAHGDERGEFLLVLPTTGLVPPPPPSTLPIHLVFWERDRSLPPPPPGEVLDPRDPLQLVAVEDAVLRDAAGQPTGAVVGDVLDGEAVPSTYVQVAVAAPAPTVVVGELIHPAPFVVV